MTARIKPILFSSEMVSAILAGRKSQTRRVIKPQPVHMFVEGLAHVTIGMDPAEDGRNWYDTDGVNPGKLIRCPYRPGDVLWVRETWLQLDRDHWMSDRETPLDRIAYLASTDTDGDRIRKEYGYKWRSPIHMPRWAARLWLRVTAVRAERVQDISDEDARAEGCDGKCPVGHIPTYLKGPCSYQYAQLWDSLNQKRGYGWNANPWVWVITFKRCEKPEVSDA